MSIQTDITDFFLRRTLDAESVGNQLDRERLARTLDDALQAVQERINSLPEGSLSRTRSLEIERQLRIALREVADEWPGAINSFREQIIRAEYDATVRSMREILGREVRETPYRLPTSKVQAIMSKPIGGAFLNDWVDRSLNGLQMRAREELAQSVILGETSQQAAARLREKFAMTRRGSNMLARTSMMQASNHAREEALGDFSDVILRWRWLATLDVRTCPTCGDLDGQEAEDLADLPFAPIHPNCRCTRVPVTEFAEDGEGMRPAVRDQEPRTVRHRDGSTSTRWPTDKQKVGQVRASTSFKDFFERQPAEWKERYLGPARYKLYREGKIDFSDLSRNNRPLTLDQLRSGA